MTMRDIIIRTNKKLPFKVLNVCLDAQSLRFFPDTLLGSSDIENYYNEEVKAYYFDRHRGMFTAILFFYQSRGVFRSPTNIDRDIVEEELEFFKVKFFHFSVPVSTEWIL